MEPRFAGLKFVKAFGFAHIESEFGMACPQLMAALKLASRPAMLNVSSKNPRAISVYEKLGFARRREMLRLRAPRNDLAAAVVQRKGRNTPIP